MSTCPRCWKQWENYLAVPAHHCEDGYLFLGERTVAIDPRVARLEAEVARLREALTEILRSSGYACKDIAAAALAPAVAADGRR